MRTTTWFAVFVLLAGSFCSAQQVIKRDRIHVVFPTTSWFETAPPEQLTALTNINPQLNIDFHAISEPAELRLHITRFEYPIIANGELIAGYLSGVRKRCGRQTREPVVEKFDTNGKIPTYFFQANLPGDRFLEIRALFCAERVYLLEIGGPVFSRKEAQQCLDGITIHEPGVQGVSADSIAKAELQFGGRSTAYELGRRFGYFIAAIFLVLGAGALAFAVHNAQSRKALGHPPIRPPGIPPPIPRSTTTPPNSDAGP